MVEIEKEPMGERTYHGLSVFQIEQVFVFPRLVGRLLFYHPAVAVEDECRVASGGIFIDDEIIFATEQFQVAAVTVTTDKHALAEQEVAAIVTIGCSLKVFAYQVCCRVQAFETAEITGRVVVGGISDDKRFFVGALASHELEPLVGCR